MIAMRSRLPGWLRRWVTTGAQYERQLTRLLRQLDSAEAGLRSLREQVVAGERRRADARAQTAAAVAAADRHAEAVARVRKVLDAWERSAGQYPAEDSAVAGQRVMVAELRRVLDGDPEAVQR